MPIREIIQLGETGGDLILKKFENIRKQKEKFSESSTVKLKKEISEKIIPSPKEVEKPVEDVIKRKKTIIDKITEDKESVEKQHGIMPKTEDQKIPVKTFDDASKKEDTIINKFKKINDLKKNFLKPGILKMGVGLESLISKEKKEAPEPQKPEREREDRVYVRGVRLASNELRGLANSAASLDPTQFTSGVIDSMKNITQKFASSIPVLGGVLSGMTDYAGEMTKIGANMASNSLNAIKAAQNSAIDTLEKRGRIQYFAGRETIGPQYSLQEQSGIVEQIANRFGKFQGTKLANTVKELFKDMPDIQQATALAAGDYRSLGTDKGYFLQQISDSLGNLPPSMGQEIQNQLLQQFVTPEGKRELNTDLAKNQRQTRAILTSQDQEREVEISKMSKNARELNETMNKLNLNLTRSGSSLNGSLENMASTINTIVSKVAGVSKAVK